MSDERIDLYAAGILRIARAEGDPDAVTDELYRIARAFDESPELRDSLSDPRLPADRKSAIVTDLLGERTSALVTGLVDFIVAAGRVRDLAAIASRLAEQAAAARDLAVAEVRAPHPLDQATVDRLQRALSSATGKMVEVKAVVDPDVLGGLVARVGDTVIDGSLRSRLESLRLSLIEG